MRGRECLGWSSGSLGLMVCLTPSSTVVTLGICKVGVLVAPHPVNQIRKCRWF